MQIDITPIEKALADERLKRTAFNKSLVPPTVCDRDHWPPNYEAVYAWRRMMLAKYNVRPDLIEQGKAYYKQHCVEFILHWCDTYDPRNVGGDKLTHFPFIMFPRQIELVQFLLSCLEDQQPGLIEKSRDMGATWVGVCFSVWMWLFWPGSAVGWGSATQPKVDKLGDPDSIFEKIRMLIRGLPTVFLPKDFLAREHLTFMRCINPENGATIIGEIGDNIGRGGRKLVYLKDEAQPLNAKLLTPSGWITMADAKVGDRVIGASGCPTTITQIKDFPPRDIYRVAFKDGTSAECSPHHLWTVDKVLSSKKFKRLTVPTHELVKLITKSHTYRAPVCSPVHFDASTDPIPLDPYVVGVLLGDGCVKRVGTVGNQGGVSFASVDQEIIDEVKRLLPVSCVISNSPGSINYRISDSRGRRCLWQGGKGRVGSKPRMLVVEAGIAGHGAETKFVPDRYKFASQQDRLSILQGLLDTDGGSVPGTVFFTSSSKRLATDVRFLVQSLGGVAYLHVKVAKGFRTNGEHHATMYVVNIVLPKGVKPFRLSRKLASMGVRKHPIAKTITSIELLDRRPVRCISVDSADGLYLTDDCIVTHNSAHYERPEAIEASLADTTRCPIDISSVNGPGNVFHRTRENGIDWYPGAVIPRGKTRVLVLDWRDHPDKTLEWYDERRRNAEDKGLLHILAQEVDRSYVAALAGTIIPNEYVRAAIDAHLHPNVTSLPTYTEGGPWGAALDVADEGGDRNALTKRQGIVLRYAEEWGARDPGISARRALDECGGLGFLELQYDCIGIGAAVKSEFNRLRDDNLIPKDFDFVPWNAGAKVLRPIQRVIEDDRESPRNKDFYFNLKAQAWWELRNRFLRTYQVVVQGIQHDYDTLISLDSKLPLLRKIEKELSQATAKKNSTLKLVVDKTPEGTTSPNLADSIVMNYWPTTKPSMLVGGSPRMFQGSEPFVSQSTTNPRISTNV